MGCKGCNFPSRQSAPNYDITLAIRANRKFRSELDTIPVCSLAIRNCCQHAEEAEDLAGGHSAQASADEGAFGLLMMFSTHANIHMPMCFIQVFDGIGEGSCDASLSEVRQYFVGLNFHVVLPAAAFTELASSFTTNSDGRIEWQVRFLGFHPSCSESLSAPSYISGGSISKSFLQLQNC